MTIADRAEVGRIVAQAFRVEAEGHDANIDTGRNAFNSRVPVDPSIREGDARYVARVLVSIPQTDGSVVTTVVRVPSDGPMTGAEIIAAAIAAATSGTLTPPPPSRPRGGPAPSGPTGVIYTIGRGSPTLGF